MKLSKPEHRDAEIEYHELFKAMVPILKFEEGYRENPYKDTVGLWTVLYGHNLSHNGFGNLSAAAFTTKFTKSHVLYTYRTHLSNKYSAVDSKSIEKVGEFLLRTHVSKDLLWLKSQSFFAEKPLSVKLAVALMVYQMGRFRFKKFRTTIHFINAGNYELAAYNASKSLWAQKQSPQRAARVCDLLADPYDARKTIAKYLRKSGIYE